LFPQYISYSGDETASTQKVISYVYVDDSKSVSNLNVSMSSALILDAAEKAQEKKVVAVRAGKRWNLSNIIMI